MDVRSGSLCAAGYRLAAAELETRWNRALQRAAEIEAKVAAHDASTPARNTVLPRSLIGLAEDLQAVWRAPATDARLRKRIVRTVVQQVVADLNEVAGKIELLIHWTGGVHMELRLPRRQRGQRNATSSDIIAAVRHHGQQHVLDAAVAQLVHDPQCTATIRVVDALWTCPAFVERHWVR